MHPQERLAHVIHIGEVALEPALAVKVERPPLFHRTQEAVAILAARGSAVLLEWSPSSQLRTGLALLLVLFVGSDILSTRAGILGPLRCPQPPWPTDAPTGKPIVTLKSSQAVGKCGARGGTAPAITAGVAILDAHESMCPRDGGSHGRRPGLFGLDTPGYQGEAWVEGSGTVEITSRTQNTLTLQVYTLRYRPPFFLASWMLCALGLLILVKLIAPVP